MSGKLSAEALAEIDPWLAVCGACDGGIGMCTHPDGDYRVPMAMLRGHIDAQQAEIEALTRRNVAMEDRIAARAVRSTARVPDCEYGCDLDTFGTHQDDCPFDAEAVARRARHASDS